MNKKLYHPPAIVDELIVLDGLTRSGKFLLGKIVSNFQNVEYFQYPAAMEHIPYLYKMGMLDRDNAIAYLKINANMSTYDMGVGRYLNTRVDDNSSILNATDYKEYVARTVAPDGNIAMERFKQLKRVPSVLTHEVLPLVDLYLEAFPYMKMINIKRHPVDLAHSWHSRRLGERFGADPLTFTPTFDYEGHALPWFMMEWQEQFAKMKPVERVVKSITSLYRFDQKALESLDNQVKEKSIFEVSYENLIEKPLETVSLMGAFIGQVPHSNMDTILKRERCFRKLLIEDRKNKYDEIRNECDSSISDELKETSKAYEKYWAIDSIFN